MNSALLQIVGSITLAIIPTLLWGAIFYVKNPYRRTIVFYAFFLGATAVFPILFYKYLWQFLPWINAFRYTRGFESDAIGITNIISIPLSVIITFAIVGVIEELMKHLAVRMVDTEIFQDIDDVVEISIIAALGFSFTENIMYFHNIWVHQGAANLMLPFLFRTIFSTFAHVMFSAIMGYYYGIAHFATPILRQQHAIMWPRLMERIFGVDDESIYAKQKTAQGLLIAAGIHAIFNIFLEMNWTIMLAPFILLGYLYVNHLFTMKENHKKYGLLMRRESPATSTPVAETETA